MRKHIRPLLWALTALGAARMFLFIADEARSADHRPAPPAKNWVCYYGGEDKTKELARFDLAVLDPTTPQPPKNASGRPVKLGYVSVGEVDESHKIYSRLKNKRFLVQKNENWQSHMVDIRALGWRQTLFGTLIPEIYAKGFDGVFLDTIDSALFLEDKDPKYKGMSEAVLKLLKTMREKYPHGLICQNRGYEILEKTAKYIDYVLLESFYTTVDFKNNAYPQTSASDRQYVLERVAKAKAVNPNLIVLTLDYVKPTDTRQAREAIAFSRKNGFVPYVSTHDLHAVYTTTLDR